MILSPLPNKCGRRVPVGVITSYGSVESETGAKILYSGSAVHALRAVRKHGGYAFAIKGNGKTRWISFHYCGFTVYPVSQPISLREATSFRDFCFERGISARSLQAMGFYLLRHSLSGYIDLDEGKGIPLHLFPSGAFTFHREGVYKNVYQSDIRAAYTSALVSISPALSFSSYRRISPERLTDEPGSFALVSVRIISNRPKYRVLPSLDSRGKTTWGSKGWRREILSTNDLRLAIRVGIPLSIERAWIPSRVCPTPFSSFLPIVKSAREQCGRAAKIATNSVWGVFSAGSAIRRYDFSGGGRITHRDLPLRSKICLPLAFSVVSHLRERIITEAWGEGCFHAHTDGVIADYPVITGEDIGNWQVRGVYDEVVIVSPNCYSYTVGEKTTYKISGVTVDRRNFRERLNRGN